MTLADQIIDFVVKNPWVGRGTIIGSVQLIAEESGMPAPDQELIKVELARLVKDRKLQMRSGDIAAEYADTGVPPPGPRTDYKPPRKEPQEPKKKAYQQLAGDQCQIVLDVIHNTSGDLTFNRIQDLSDLRADHLNRVLNRLERDRKITASRISGVFIYRAMPATAERAKAVSKPAAERVAALLEAGIAAPPLDPPPFNFHRSITLLTAANPQNDKATVSQNGASEPSAVPEGCVPPDRRLQAEHSPSEQSSGALPAPEADDYSDDISPEDLRHSAAADIKSGVPLLVTEAEFALWSNGMLHIHVGNHALMLQFSADATGGLVDYLNNVNGSGQKRFGR